MQVLNLPVAALRIRRKGERTEVFDKIRKKFIALTPEEWVRQHFIHYLTLHRNVPDSLIAVEASLKYNRLRKRSDIVVYGNDGTPRLIVECKAPDVELTQAVFDQVAMYNMTLKVPYLAVTNGMEHYACFIDHETKKYYFLKELPDYNDLLLQVPEIKTRAKGM
jgi:type I site-specific restriction endonuclease